MEPPSAASGECSYYEHSPGFPETRRFAKQGDPESAGSPGRMNVLLMANPRSSGHVVGMRLVRLQSFALSLPHTTVVKQWGECLVHKVAGKMFLILVLDGGSVAGVIFKCTPEEFEELPQIEGIIQAPYCAKRMWAKVEDLLALPESELNARIRRSYELVVECLPKKTRKALGLLTE